MNRTRTAQMPSAVLLGLVLAFTWTVATAAEAPPSITELTASAADGQFSFPFTGFGTAVAIRGDTAWVGIPLYVNSDIASTQSGRVGIFTLDKSTGAWNRSGSLDVTDQVNGEARFGSTIALRERDAAVGSYDAVRIYSRTGQKWQVLTKITNDAPNHVLGPVLAYDGSTLAVRVTDTASAEALVYVYEIGHQGVVRLAAKLTAPPDDTGPFGFGSSLALSRNTLVVGSPAGYSISSPNPPGMTYVYSQKKGTWQLVQSLSSSEAAEGDDFGAAVAIDGDVLLVGAPYEDVEMVQDGWTSAGGAVYVFRREHGGPWTQTQRVRPTAYQNGVGAFSGFGWSLAMAGQRVAIGAPLTTDAFQDDLGQTDVYHWQGETLTFDQKVETQSSPSPGFSLSMWRDRLIIGVDAFVHAPINEAWIVDFGSRTGQ